MSQYPPDFVIAVDGHSSSGKSTFAKAIARLLNYKYIDSGAMYRAVTLYALRNDLVADPKGLVAQLDRINIDFLYNESRNKHETFLNGENIEKEIRESPEVAESVSPVSKIGPVREKMVGLQRSMSIDGGLVMDGRDIGTVVFPGADIKIFLTTGVEIRARRRFDELMEKGLEVRLEDIIRNIADRDDQDSNREISPLRKADDAIELDNGQMTVEEQMKWFKELLSGKMHKTK